MILAALNLLVSYTLFPDHPIMAAANAAMALILAVGVIMSWRSSLASGKAQRRNLTGFAAMVVKFSALLRWLARYTSTWVATDWAPYFLNLFIFE